MMNFWIILLIGIVYVAHSEAENVFEDKEPMLSEDGKNISCGRKWKPKGVMYHVVRKYEDDEGNTLKPPEPIYEYCVNENTKLVMYARYNLDDPTRLTPMPQHEKQESDLSGVPEPSPRDEKEDSDEPEVPEPLPQDENEESDAPKSPKSLQDEIAELNTELNYRRQGSDASESSSMYPRQLSSLKILSPKETFELRKYYDIPSPFEFDPQLVVVPDLMPSLRIKRSFYNLEITAPMQGELVEPWEQLMKKIESQIYKIREPLKVYSGGFDTYRLHGVSWYIDRPNRKLPVPFAWFLLLHNEDETRGISVVMQNYAFSLGEKKNALCGESVCEKARLEIPKYNRAWIYCCPASTITEEYGVTKKDMGVDDLLIFESEE
ncbi:uncharacterized protein LOC135844610 [Planococcus citri]|uniref:uncharacterized protein LOC135844610 n=1 Tax=Planococcus citri TaxID=170843 RepID=UPI0031F9EBAA